MQTETIQSGRSDRSQETVGSTNNGWKSTDISIRISGTDIVYTQEGWVKAMVHGHEEN
jgi:hypothetical protein